MYHIFTSSTLLRYSVGLKTQRLGSFPLDNPIFALLQTFINTTKGMVWIALKSCFQGVGEDSKDTSSRPNCVFCDKNNIEANIIAETDSVIVFRDHKPAATEHLLVIPRKHIRSVRHLTGDDVGLVRELEAAGRQALLSLGHAESTHRMGFHIPPFNSVNHLHLHVQALPYLTSVRGAKYPLRAREDGSKGWTWFAEVNQVCRILEAGNKVRVRPC